MSIGCVRIYVQKATAKASAVGSSACPTLPLCATHDPDIRHFLREIGTVIDTATDPRISFNAQNLMTFAASFA